MAFLRCCSVLVKSLTVLVAHCSAVRWKKSRWACRKFIFSDMLQPSLLHAFRRFSTNNLSLSAWRCWLWDNVLPLTRRLSIPSCPCHPVRGQMHHLKIVHESEDQQKHVPLYYLHLTLGIFHEGSCLVLCACVLCIALTKFFIRPSLMCKGGNKIFIDSTSGGYWTLFPMTVGVANLSWCKIKVMGFLSHSGLPHFCDARVTSPQT